VTPQQVRRPKQIDPSTLPGTRLARAVPGKVNGSRRYNMRLPHTQPTPPPPGDPCKVYWRALELLLGDPERLVTMLPSSSLSGPEIDQVLDAADLWASRKEVA
jgi:hypothetical protein